MIKNLKMDLYHLIRGKSLWILLVAMIVSIVGSMGLLSFLSSPEFVQAINSASSDGSDAAIALPPRSYASPTAAYGSLLASGVVSMLVSIAVGLLTAVDFDSGFVRNIFSAQRGRLSYFGAKIGLILVLSAIFVLVGIAATEIVRQMFGFTYDNMDSIPNILLWFVSAVLVMSAYATFVAALVWLTRSKAAGIAAAIVVSSGILESILLQIFSPLLSSLGPLAHIPEWLLYSQNGAVGAGATALLASPMNVARVIGVAVVAIAVCFAIGSAIASRRDA